MRTLLVAMCVLFCAAVCRADDSYLADSEYSAYAAAWRQAKAANKPLLLLVCADWCGPCRKLADCHYAEGK